MPLGNSITDGAAGSTDDTGYRRSLYLSLTAGGDNVDFVGSQLTGIPTDFDRDHEGYPGIRAFTLRDQVYSLLEAQDGVNNDDPVDIVLLHIGTNDIARGRGAYWVAEYVGDILHEVDRYESNYGTEITVILARIINQSDPTTDEGQMTSSFNTRLQTLGDNRYSEGDAILVVDMENALTYPNDMYDLLHPNDSGYEKMAQVWFSSLDSFLPGFCAQPPNVAATVSGSDVVLSWNDDGTADSYTLFVGTSPYFTAYEADLQDSSPTNPYIHSGVATSGQNYFYFVRAYRGVGWTNSERKGVFSFPLTPGSGTGG